LFIIGDCQHILVGSAGDFLGDIVDALDGGNEDIAEDDLVKAVSGGLVLLGW